MNCPNCPLGDGPCRGEPWHVERFCQLLDPANPKHDPRYADVVVGLSEGRMPSAAQQAANLAGSLWDWAISGFSMAGEDEVARRLAICATCPQWDDGRCKLCGCYLAAKVRLKTEHCPISKW